MLGWGERGGRGAPDFSVNSFLFSYNTKLPANDESPEAKWAGIHGADCCLLSTDSAAIRRLQQPWPTVSTQTPTS